MNAFPAELVQHHYACMLVAGLLPPPQQSRQARSGSPERPTAPEGSTSEPRPQEQVDRSPPPSQASAALPSQANAQPSTGSKLLSPSEAFPQIAKDLSDIFASRGRSTAWDPAKAKSAVFHSVLVDHNVRLPPRKTRPTPRTLAAVPPGQQSAAASLQPRSPLSPLHPSSPLFPDGLIAPIWLRKHRQLVPAVFVAFYCLAEHVTAVPPPTPPKDGTKGVDGDQGISSVEEEKLPKPTAPGLSGPEVKACDEELIRVISERRRSLSERGIKLTVVLLTTRSMLESPTLEQRLSYIRRSSQLDSRASLFVLTPVSKAELGEFVTSLQSALYDPAMDYYREHFRRIRRKRTKYPPSAAVVSQIMTAAAEIRGSQIKDNALSREGWLARSDYKMGTFAELGGNLDDALTHYTNAYQMLANDLLTSTLLLPPRTKRWAEAKVLADTLSVRISKLLLYRDDGEGAWVQFRSHVKKFTELSQGWGIGAMTFEFWSWLGKQYRLMGDLLDLAMREVPGSPFPPFRPSTHFPPMPTYLLHPSHLPTPTASGNVATSYNPQHGSLAAPNDAAMASSVVTADMCPGAGECFYIAGVCALERWERFRRLSWEEQSAGNADAQPTENWSSISLFQEQKVDHAAQAIEVLTRAHEVFKRQRRHRLSLFVASKIANAYLEAEQNELGLRFLERIANSYRLEGWPAPLVSQLLLALQAAQRSQEVESEGRALWRLLGAGVPLDIDQRIAALAALGRWSSEKELREDKRPLRIECSRSDGPLLVNVTFAKTEVDLDGSAVAFQISLMTPKGRTLDGVEFDRVIVHLRSEQEGPKLVIANRSGASMSRKSFAPLDCVDLRATNAQESLNVGSGSLAWAKGDDVRVFEGTLIPRQVGLLQISKVSLEMDGKTPTCIEFDLLTDEEERALLIQPIWYVQMEPMRTQSLPFQQDLGGIEVRRRRHKLDITLLHESEAYLDESFAITLCLTNTDSVALQCTLDVHVIGPPGEMMSSDEAWVDEHGKEERSNSLREVKLGELAQGATMKQSIVIACRGHLASRTVDFVLKSSAQGEKDGIDGTESETTSSVMLPVKAAFSSSFYAQWRLLRDAGSGSRRVSMTPTLDGDERKTPNGKNLPDPEEISALAVGADDMAHVTAVAALNVGLTTLAREEIEIVKVDAVLDFESKHLRIWSPSKESGAIRSQSSTVTGTWRNGDRWGGVYDIEVLSESAAGMPIEAEDASLRPTGKLQIAWRRTKRDDALHGDGRSTCNLATLSLPLLLPPHLLSRLIVSLPASTTIEQPLVMLITIVNPSRLAADIFINIDDSNADFGLQSHRSFTVPNLLPRSTRSVPVHVAPRKSVQANMAAVKTLPRVRAWQRDRRQTAQAAEMASSTRTSLEGTGAPPSIGAREEELLQIVNQRPGAGVPLEVSLRYTTRTAGGVGTTAAGAAVMLPSAVAGMHSAGGSKADDSAVDPLAAASTTVDVAAHLQAETQRTGQWTIFVH